MQKHMVNGVEYSAKETSCHSCKGCAAEIDGGLCEALPGCGSLSREDGQTVIWVRTEPSPPDVDDSDDSWPDDDGAWCERCKGDGRDPMTDYLLPCPACQSEQH